MLRNQTKSLNLREGRVVESVGTQHPLSLFVIPDYLDHLVEIQTQAEEHQRGDIRLPPCRRFSVEEVNNHKIKTHLPLYTLSSTSNNSIINNNPHNGAINHSSHTSSNKSPTVNPTPDHLSLNKARCSHITLNLSSNTAP